MTQPPVNHQFQQVGTYTVTLNLAPDPTTQFTVAQVVRVAAATSVPTLTETATLILVLALALIAMHRLG